jgi:hypothetical protein
VGGAVEFCDYCCLGRGESHPAADRAVKFELFILLTASSAVGRDGTAEKRGGGSQKLARIINFSPFILAPLIKLRDQMG